MTGLILGCTKGMRLVPWLPPADYRGPLTIVEQATGQRHDYEIASENIIQTEVQEPPAT